MIESPDIIERLRALVESGGAFMALFDRSMVQRSRALELIEVLLESLPEELEQARSILERQDQILEEARQQAGEIVDDAVKRAERLVDADSITRRARERSDEIMDDSDRYVAERLESLEHELNTLLSEVRAGIESMQSRTQSGRGSDPGQNL